MSEKQIYLYHVVYHYSSSGRNGIGSLTVELNKKITSSKAIKDIKEYIENKNVLDDVVITNWKELESW